MKRRDYLTELMRQRPEARTQAEHEAINAVEYPGTRQLCVCCDSPTGRCEEDSIFIPPKDPNGNGLGPLCEECCDAYLVPNAADKGPA